MWDVKPNPETQAPNHNQKHDREIDKRIENIALQAYRAQGIQTRITESGYGGEQGSEQTLIDTEYRYKTEWQQYEANRFKKQGIFHDWAYEMIEIMEIEVIDGFIQCQAIWNGEFSRKKDHKQGDQSHQAQTTDLDDDQNDP